MESILQSLRAALASAREHLHQLGDATKAAAKRADYRLGEIYSRNMSDRLHF
jgi:hypothetical protein